MDRLESLGSTLSQLTVYDLKSYYNQAKNMVLNVSEMEAKVREATNDEPWGASSTLMQEIAQGTFNFQQFNEIMPCIYSRFMEKEARQWREIYKALQLLEYIIKHGSERVVDDARSHISTIKMLRNFHYIDDKGKDQGANIRNRSSEIVVLLSDLEKIRAERRKAKANKSKYVGTGNDGFGGGYGGFGDGGYSGGGDYYNSGGSSSFRDDSGRKTYEEYDAGEYEERPVHRSSSLRSPTSPTGRSSGSNTRQSRPPADAAKDKAKEKAVVVDDLLGDWGDDSGFGGGSAAAATGSGKEKALPALAAPGASDGGDDFADFQSAPLSPPLVSSPVVPPSFAPAPLAPITTTTTAAALPAQANAKPNVFEFLNQTQTVPPPMQQLQQQQQQQQQLPQAAPLQPQTARPNYFNTGGGPISSVRATSFGNAAGAATRPPPTPAAAGASVGQGHAAKPSSSANFDDLWSLGLGASGKSAAAPGGGAGKSIKDLEREKAQAGIWGAATASQPGLGGVQGSSGGAFAGAGGAGSAAPVGGGDDLLL